MMEDRQELKTVNTKKNKPYNKRAIITLGCVMLIGLIIMAVASSSPQPNGKKRQQEAPKYEPAEASQALDLDKKTEVKTESILDKYQVGEETITPAANNSKDDKIMLDTPAAEPDINNLEQDRQAALQAEQDRQNQIKQARQQWLELQRATYLSQPQIQGQWTNDNARGQDAGGGRMGAVDNNNNTQLATAKNPYLEVYERYLNDNKTSSPQTQQSAQTDKEKFFNSTDSGRGVLRNTLQKQQSPYLIPSGTLIPCALISGVNSDLPGNIIAQVTENVCDWRKPDKILIPYGTKVFGVYDSRMAFAQRRVQLSWQKLIFPDGTTLDLAGMPGVTKQGYSGLSDKYYPRYGRLLTAAIMTAAFSSVGLLFDDNNSNNQTIVSTSSGTVVVPNNNDSPRSEFAKAIAESIGGAGTKLFDKMLNSPPTVLIRPAKRFNIMVNADIPFWTAFGKL